jgi:Undecaprenyl-phosphate glucose phosphotransferase
MLKQHNQLALGLLMLADALAVACAWLASYWLRFNFLPVDPAKGVPGLQQFLAILPLIVGAHVLVFYRLHLYRPRRSERLFSETRDIVKAFIVAVVIVILIDYALPQSHKISRQFVATYALLGTTLFALFRFTVRAALRLARRAGYNRRYAAIVGSGRIAQRLLLALQHHRWTGLDVAYFVDDRAGAHRGIPICGPISDLRRIVEEKPVDAVFIALPSEQAHRLENVLDALALSMADVRLVPDVNPIYAMRPDVSQLGGVPILALRQTPLDGRNALIKRSFDIVVGGGCLLVALLPMAVIALLIKLGSPGPVLYRQRRMGLDGREFMMHKFRTMRIDAEATGPQWSQREDPRRTAIGAFLRRTSLDELPNLLNVLRGEMSLVGPRPERPEFVAEFKHEIPNYMLRHKMKAGMTGYAQVKGLRGDTSLKKRIQHDVHYIRHWSLALDVRILLQTLVSVWFSSHEDVPRPPTATPTASNS